MPKFELISIEEALEATKETRWLDEKFGEEHETDLGECNCLDASETEYIDTDNRN